MFRRHPRFMYSFKEYRIKWAKYYYLKHFVVLCFSSCEIRYWTNPDQGHHSFKYLENAGNQGFSWPAYAGHKTFDLQIVQNEKKII